jgi:hypothetical protein
LASPLTPFIIIIIIIIIQLKLHVTITQYGTHQSLQPAFVQDRAARLSAAPLPVACRTAQANVSALELSRQACPPMVAPMVAVLLTNRSATFDQSTAVRLLVQLCGL